MSDLLSPGTPRAGRRDESRCPLCGGVAFGYHEDGDRRYFHCGSCELVHLERRHWPTPDEERERYLLHRNHRTDAGYVRFLQRLADPVAERVPAGSRGLDFGCGPAPVLAELLAEKGIVMASYDPLFFAEPALLGARYDLVTCCEVLEHVHDPDQLLDRLSGLLCVSGLLAVMTSLRRDDQDFGNWRYRRDPTHVCFYHRATMEWIARRRCWGLERPADNVALFTVPAAKP